MNPLRILAIVLIVAGALALAYGGFTYTQDTHTAQVGPIGLSVSEERTIGIPVWAGAGALAAGLVLIVLGGRKG
jgi:TRAP-type C4-dicarboxylate transport system permease small subunit